LERLARVDAIVFDKTGTLTEAGGTAVTFHHGSLPGHSGPGAKSEIRNPKSEPAGSRLASGPSILPGSGLDPTEAGWVLSLTRHSTHPYSTRMSEVLADRNPAHPVQAFVETPGSGIEGRVQGHEIWLGSPGWLESRGVRLGPPPMVTGHEPATRSGTLASAAEVSGEPQFAATETRFTGSVVALAIDGRYRGVFELSNAVRPETDRLLRRLSGGYELALLSGDNERERERFRGLFGGEGRLRFNQSPLEKLGFIRDLQQSGRTVMMVGDGLNDAGALKQSDVGVAVVEQVGAFSPASDMILEAGRVPRLFEVLTLARRAVAIVRLGFGISALYNVVGIGIASAGLLSPVICAVLMPVSSVSVVLFACGATTWSARRLGLPA
jgi:Cu+-exporting ATPase